MIVQKSKEKRDSGKAGLAPREKRRRKVGRRRRRRWRARIIRLSLPFSLYISRYIYRGQDIERCHHLCVCAHSHTHTQTHRKTGDLERGAKTCRILYTLSLTSQSLAPVYTQSRGTD